MTKQHVCHRSLFEVKQRVVKIQSLAQVTNCKKLRRIAEIQDYYLEYKVSLYC